MRKLLPLLALFTVACCAHDDVIQLKSVGPLVITQEEMETNQWYSWQQRAPDNCNTCECAAPIATVNDVRMYNLTNTYCWCTMVSCQESPVD